MLTKHESRCTLLKKKLEKKVLYFIKWDSDIEKDYWKNMRCELNIISSYVISIRKNGWKTHYPILSRNKIINCIGPNCSSNEYYKFWHRDTQRDVSCSMITKRHEDSTLLNGTFFLWVECTDLPPLKTGFLILVCLVEQGCWKFLFFITSLNPKRQTYMKQCVWCSHNS